MEEADLQRLFSKRSSRVRLSPIRKVATLLEEAVERSEIISFGGGAPSLLPPKELLDVFVEELKKDTWNFFRYTSTKGYPMLKERIAEDVKDYTGVEYDPTKEIIITEGSTEGLFLVLSAILEEGDEIILTDPTYLGYSEPISFLNAREVRIKQEEENNYQPSLEEIKEKISDKTKAILINTPENPTGRILDAKIAKGIVEIAKDKGLFVIIDEAYKHIVYDEENVFLERYDKNNVISVCSFSKEASVPGFRLGYICANAEVISRLEKIKQFVTLCSNMVGQKMLVHYLTGDIKKKYLNEVVIPTYKARRDFMLKMIKEYLSDAKAFVPQGAFYVFLNLKNYLPKNFDDEAFMMDLFAKKHLAIIPGSYFGESGLGYFRLTFVSEDFERIEEGIRRLSEYLNVYVK